MLDAASHFTYANHELFPLPPGQRGGGDGRFAAIAVLLFFRPLLFVARVCVCICRVCQLSPCLPASLPACLLADLSVCLSGLY